MPQRVTSKRPRSGSLDAPSRRLLSFVLLSVVTATLALAGTPARAAAPRLVPQSVDRSAISLSAVGTEQLGLERTGAGRERSDDGRHRQRKSQSRPGPEQGLHPGVSARADAPDLEPGRLGQYHNVVFEDCDIDVTIPNWSAALKNRAPGHCGFTTCISAATTSTVGCGFRSRPRPS